MATEFTAPMVGKIVEVLVAEGDAVKADQPCFVMEAMKMKIDVVAPASGTIKGIKVQAGSAVTAGALLAEIE